MLESGFVVATARILRRVWQIYVAHVFLFTIFLAEISYVATRFENPLYSEEMGIMDFLKQPDVTIVQALLLRFRPVNMDVLPLYIVLMLFLPVILWLMKWRTDVTLALSVALYAITWQYDLYLSAYPNGFWAFNPFAWQLLFFLGAWTAVGGAGAVESIVRTRTVFFLAIGYLVFALVVTMAINSPHLGNVLPSWMLEPFDPNDKTNLAPYRIVHLIALAIIITRFLPADSAILKWRSLMPLIKCGQNSLPVFCSGIVLSFCAHAAIEESLNSLWVQIFAAVIGVALMTAVAYCWGSLKERDHIHPARPRARGFA